MSEPGSQSRTRRLQAVAEGFDLGRQGRPIVVRRYLGPDFQMMNAQGR